MKNLNPHQEFERTLQAHFDQYYEMIPKNVNEEIQKSSKILKKKSLTQAELWAGEKEKGKKPHIYTDAIVVCALIENTYQKTHYGETYERYSIQPCWITGNLVVVKEETHSDESQKKMIFFGRKVDEQQAKALLIPAIISEIERGSEKAINLIPKENQRFAKAYLEAQFEKHFFNEKPALFNVLHGIKGDAQNPVETWDLVRLAKSVPAQTQAYQRLRARIASNVSTKLYLETINLIENLI